MMVRKAYFSGHSTADVKLRDAIRVEVHGNAGPE